MNSKFHAKKQETVMNSINNYYIKNTLSKEVRRQRKTWEYVTPSALKLMEGFFLDYLRQRLFDLNIEFDDVDFDIKIEKDTMDLNPDEYYFGNHIFYFLLEIETQRHVFKRKFTHKSLFGLVILIEDWLIEIEKKIQKGKILEVQNQYN
jgi:hypothetical protein